MNRYTTSYNKTHFISIIRYVFNQYNIHSLWQVDKTISFEKILFHYYIEQIQIHYYYAQICDKLIEVDSHQQLGFKL